MNSLPELLGKTNPILISFKNPRVRAVKVEAGCGVWETLKYLLIY